MYTACVSHGLRATHTPGAQRQPSWTWLSLRTCGGTHTWWRTRGSSWARAGGKGVTDLGQPGSRGREPRASPPSPSRGRGVGGVPVRDGSLERVQWLVGLRQGPRIEHFEKLYTEDIYAGVETTSVLHRTTSVESSLSCTVASTSESRAPARASSPTIVSDCCLCRLCAPSMP